MIRKALVIVGGLMNLLWGVSHLFPTNAVVAGFGEISIDNQRIIRMEWINEGLTLIFIGLLVIAISIVIRESTKASKVVFISSSIMLFSMAILSLKTGFQIDFIPFRLCPIIFSTSGVLILQGAFRK
jgi:hypothetical protein